MFVINYIIGVLYGVDQLVNRILFGSADHTISGRVGYFSIKGNLFSLYIEPFINALFFWQDSHCRNSIEWDEVPAYNGEYTPMLKVRSWLSILLGVVEWGFIVKLIIHLVFI